MKRDARLKAVFSPFRAFVVRYGFRNNLYTIWTSLYSFTVESIHYPLIEKQTDGFRDLQRQGLAIQLIAEKKQDTSHIMYQPKNKLQKCKGLGLNVFTWIKWMLFTLKKLKNQNLGSHFEPTTHRLELLE